MAEIQLTRIKSIYGDVKGFLSQIPSVDIRSFVQSFTVETFNDVVNNLTNITDTDYTSYKIPDSQRNASLNTYESTLVRAQIGRLIGRLEEEYGFGRENITQQSPSIAIFNENQNKVSLQVNYTINDLIDKAGDEEKKTQLRELRDELEKPNKNWEKIKSILTWALNLSKELFLEILPIILQKKL